MVSGQECNTNIVDQENKSTGVRKKSKMAKLGSQSNQAKCQRGNEVKEEPISPTKKNGFVSKKLNKASESNGPSSVVGDRDKGVTRKPRRKPAPKSFRKRA